MFLQRGEILLDAGGRGKVLADKLKGFQNRGRSPLGKTPARHRRAKRNGKVSLCGYCVVWDIPAVMDYLTRKALLCHGEPTRTSPARVTETSGWQLARQSVRIYGKGYDLGGVGTITTVHRLYKNG